MEAVPRLPMISFDLKTSDPVTFATSLKQYIASFYHEEPESYNGEIQSLESLRSAAVRPSIEVASCQILKKYYCQLHFLKARFPMEEGQPAAVYFSWRDAYSGMFCSVSDIKFELMCVLFNIGALHTQLGAEDSRVSPDGMKMSCTHFQCAAWAFQTIKETYPQLVSLVLAPEIVHFMQEVCLAQAQECILEKSMMDSRKATIIAKVAVQVEEYYKQALGILQGSGEEGSFNELLPRRTYKSWSKYLYFKVAYHRCLSLLYQGQQAEEQQKMGERVAFYQAACNQLEDARKLAKNLDNHSDFSEALSFTSDVVEGKRKAAKNENEFIYHEEVPEKEALLEVKGASLVKGIPFNVHDIEVSGPDIFGRLVPMEAHEASSVYSEQKAEMLRRVAEQVELKDQHLAEYMSSLQLDFLGQLHQASGLPQEIVDRAAALSAKPDAIQELVNVMAKLAGASQDVESMLSEMDHLLQEEKQSEEEYQRVMGARPPGIVATDLSREAAKYREAHTKASDSNINLHKAMSNHITYLKILSLPLPEIQKQIPSFDVKSTMFEDSVKTEVENLVKKVDEMKAQRAMLYGQLRDAACQDDITSLLVTRQPDQPLDQLFQQELRKHQKQAALIEQNLAAQDNILRALTDAYARFSDTRKAMQDILHKRCATIGALLSSYLAYDDLLAKANKGIDFYNKLETNITKLLQRVKSTCKVQEEEREQILVKNSKKPAISSAIHSVSSGGTKSGGPKLRDYLDAKANELAEMTHSYQQPVAPNLSHTGLPHGYDNGQALSDSNWIPSVRPTPVGSEKNSDIPTYHTSSNMEKQYGGYTSYTPTNYNQYSYQNQYTMSGGDEMYKNSAATIEQNLSERLQNLTVSKDTMKKFTPDVAATYGTQNIQAYAPQGLPNQSQIVGSQYSTAGNQYSNAINPYSTSGSQYSTTSGNQYSAAGQYSTPSYSTYGQSSTTEHPSQPYVDYPAQANTSGYASQSMPAYQQYSQEYYTPNNQTQNSNYTNTVPSYYSSNNTSGSSSGIPATTTAPNVSTYDQNYAYTGQYNYNGAYQNPDGFQQYYNAFGIPNQSQIDPNCMQYTSAGNHPSQTVNTADSSNISYGSNSENYYHTPYGYQGITGQDMPPYSAPSISSSSVNPYINQSSSSMTYMQSNAETGAMTIPSITSQVTSPVTSYGVESIGAVSQSVNIDLLTGLDFSVNQPTLEPQQTKQETVATTVQQVAKPAPVVDTTTVAIKKERIERETIQHVEKVKRKTSDSLPRKDPLLDPEILNNFVQEIEKFEKFVDGLTSKTLNGPTPLELKWKEIQTLQYGQEDAPKLSISVARCYPMKNRFPDILPYDESRVELKSTKDDYVNASYLKRVTPHSPPYIVTQEPLASTIGDFWTMLWEQRVEIIVCLLNDSEVESQEYWPVAIKQNLLAGKINVVLESINSKQHWTERTYTICSEDSKYPRSVTHFQLSSWPANFFPTSPVSFLSLVNSVLQYHQQQQNATAPIVIHCLAGVGRSGLFCLVASVLAELAAGQTTLPDLVATAVQMSNYRKNILKDREYLKFGYQVVLYHAQELLMKRGILTTRSTFEETRPRTHTRHPSQDLLRESLGMVPAAEGGNKTDAFEAFNKDRKGSLSNSLRFDPDDPLSSLDPLWTIRK